MAVKLTFNVTMVGGQSLVAKIESLPEFVRTKLKAKVTELTYDLVSLVKRKLTNDVLHVRTGALRDSIFPRIIDEPTRIIGRVASSGNVKYAAIHEFGGTTAPHIIQATRAKALYFQMGGKDVFAKYVNHPGSRIPERSYLRSSLTDMTPRIREELSTTVKEAARGGLHR